MMHQQVPTEARATPATPARTAKLEEARGAPQLRTVLAAACPAPPLQPGAHAPVRAGRASPPAGPGGGPVQPPAHALQRRLGNRGVQRMLAPGLSVRPAGDRYEEEADRIARQVMLPSAPPVALPISRLPQPSPAPLQADTTELAPGTAEPELVASISAGHGLGAALPVALRRHLEPRLGADLGAVRIHTDDRADALNRDLGSHAFTTGADIYFRRGHYAPEDPAGRVLLAHELTHVVQQDGLDGATAQRTIQRGSIWQTVMLPLVEGASAVLNEYLLRDLCAELMKEMSSGGADLLTYLAIARSTLAMARTAVDTWRSVPPGYQTLLMYLVGSCIYCISPGFMFPEWLFTATAADLTSDALVLGINLLSAAVTQLDRLSASASDLGNNLLASSRELTQSVLGYLASAWRGTQDDAAGPSKPAPAPASAPAPARRLPTARTVDLKILTLTIHEISTVAGQAKTGPGVTPAREARSGGLLVRAGLAVHVFGKQLEYGKDPRSCAEVLVPWGFKAPKLHLAEAFNLPGGFDVGILKVAGVSARDLWLGDAGFEAGTFTVARISLLDDVFVARNMTADVSASRLIFSAGFDLALLGWKASGAAQLELDEAGDFVEGTLSGVKAGESLSWASASFTPDRFELTDAEVLLPDYLNNTRITVPTLTVTADSITGTANAAIGDLTLLTKVLTLKAVTVAGKLDRTRAALQVTGGAELTLPGMQPLKAAFDGTYTRTRQAGPDSAPTSDFTGGLTFGAFSFTLGDAFTVKVTKSTYDSKTRTLALDSATVALPGAVDATVTGLSVGPDGVQCTGATIARKQPFRALPGTDLITLADLSATLVKDGADFSVAGTTTLKVAQAQAGVSGEVIGARLAYDKAGKLSGGFGAFELKTPLFVVSASGASFDERGIARIDTAALAILTNDASPQWGSFIPGFSAVALGLSQLAKNFKFTAKGVSVLKDKGLQVESFMPKIPSLSMSLFNGALSGMIDLENQSGKLGVDFAFPGAKFGVPLWPIELYVAAPFGPGFEASAGLQIYGGVKIKGDVQADKQPGGADALWKLSGSLAMAGVLGVKGKVSVGVGSSYLAALTAGLTIAVEAKVGANAAVKGYAAWDERTRTLRRAPGSAFELGYGLEAALVGKFGGEIQARALYVFQKTLYEVTFKEWDLGRVAIGKRIVEGADGVVSVDKENAWGFMGSKKPPQAATKESAAAEKLLKEQRQHVLGSGPLRKEKLIEVRDAFVANLNVARIESDKYLLKFNSGRGSEEKRAAWLKKMADYDKEVARARAVMTAMQWAINDEGFLERGGMTVSEFEARGKRAVDAIKTTGDALAGTSPAKPAPVAATGSPQPATASAKPPRPPRPAPAPAQPLPAPARSGALSVPESPPRAASGPPPVHRPPLGPLAAELARTRAAASPSIALAPAARSTPVSASGALAVKPAAVDTTPAPEPLAVKPTPPVAASVNPTPALPAEPVPATPSQASAPAEPSPAPKPAEPLVAASQASPSVVATPEPAPVLAVAAAPKQPEPEPGRLWRWLDYYVSNWSLTGGG